MNAPDTTQVAIEKLKVIRAMTKNTDLQQTINVIIQLLENSKKDGEMGFTGGKQ